MEHEEHDAAFEVVKDNVANFLRVLIDELDVLPALKDGDSFGSLRKDVQRTVPADGLEAPCKGTALHDSLHRRCALVDVCARTGPALPQHVHCADGVGILIMTAGNAVKHRLLRTVALVATAAGGTQAGGVGGIDLFEDPSRLFQLPCDRLSQTVEPRPQNGPVETGLLLYLLPGILDRALCAFRHFLRLQILRVHTAVLLRERMRGFSVEVQTNATHSAMKFLNLRL